jgi:hypothetical protein
MFVGPISWIVARMFYRSGCNEICKDKCKLIIDAKNEIKAVKDDRNNKLSSILSKVNEL